ncbi:MAG: hypothetical protein U9N56_02165 [Actinomycetota bacterium]|nr:hypothetical protein [Actinomycetota bacterium]
MRERSLLIVGAVIGALTIPAGLALAAINTDDASDTAPATEVVAEAVQDQDQTQLQDPGQCADCPRSELDGEPLYEQTRTQTRAQLHDPGTYEGEPVQRQQQLRTHTQVQTNADAQGPAQYGMNKSEGQYRSTNEHGPQSGSGYGGGPASNAGDCTGPSSP